MSAVSNIMHPLRFRAIAGLLAVLSVALLAGCHTVFGLGYNVVDADIVGDVRFEPDAAGGGAAAAAVRVPLTPMPMVRTQTSPFAQMRADLAGLGIEVRMSTWMIDILVRRTESTALVMHPSVATMFSNFEPKEQPLPCANPLSDDQQLQRVQAKAAQQPGRLAGPNLKLWAAERERLANIQNRPVDQAYWLYRCLGQTVEAIFPTGYVFNIIPDRERIAVVQSGVGNTMGIVFPMTLNGVRGRLIVEMKAMDAQARISYA